jgi:hypothetical protein
MEIGDHRDQGGGSEELYLWCHTCDPFGEKMVDRYDLYVLGASTQEGLLQLRKSAWQHAKERRKGRA